jgi:SAM-dependent methyltransferase
MTAQARSAGGSAARWGPLWGARPGDWAISEDQQTPTYEAALGRVPIGAGAHVLDIGCGGGAFLRLVAERGAIPHGVDASEALVSFARQRLPGADIRVGEMEQLPYEDDTFDLVTGFNSFFFADDMAAALREAARVAKPDGRVVVQVWGAHERCDLEGVKKVVRPFLPPRPPDASPDPDLAAPGVLEQIVAAGGLVVEDDFVTSWSTGYRDAEELARASVAVAGLAVLAGPEREAELKEAVVAGLADLRRPDGSYRLENEYRIVIARPM